MSAWFLTVLCYLRVLFFIRRFGSKQTMSVYMLMWKRVIYRIVLLFTYFSIFPILPVYIIVVSNAVFRTPCGVICIFIAPFTMYFTSFLFLFILFIIFVVAFFMIFKCFAASVWSDCFFSVLDNERVRTSLLLPDAFVFALTSRHFPRIVSYFIPVYSSYCCIKIVLFAVLLIYT